ncbi:MAG: O-antigen ligase family protein [Patescibacteria group bacterium]
MTLKNNIFSKKSQLFWATGIILFSGSFLLPAPPFLKIVLALFFGLIPLFLANPVYFLYFIFLATPALREVAHEQTITDLGPFAVNFNAVLNAGIAIMGIYIFVGHREKFIKLFKNKFIFFWALFGILAAAGIMYAPDKTKALAETIRITTIFIIFISALLLVKNKLDFKILITCMLAGLAVPILVGAGEWITGSGWYDKTIIDYRPNGTFLHPATFAFYLLCSLPIWYAVFHLAKENKYRILSVLGGAIGTILIFATLTRGAWVGLLAILGLYGLVRNRKMLIFATLGLIFLYLLIPPIQGRINDIVDPKYNSSFVIRQRIVNTTLPAVAQAPILGNGFGQFEHVHYNYNPEAYTYNSLQAHNDYLRIIIELGSIGLSAYLLIYFFLLKWVISEYRQTEDKERQALLFSLIMLWAGMLTVSLGDNILRTMPVQYLAWGYTGAVVGYLFKERRI